MNEERTENHEEILCACAGGHVVAVADGAGLGECRDVSTTYADIIARMEADESVSAEGKALAIANVINGRWFSDALDEHYHNPSLWK